MINSKLFFHIFFFIKYKISPAIARHLIHWAIIKYFFNYFIKAVII